MDSNLTVAIVMATYNGEAFLEQQLESILSQTYQNFKLYISDDKSSDSTISLILKYHNKYPNKIFYTLNKKNMGLVKNFEILIKNSIENYIALSDQDDIWHNNKLELQMKEMLLLEQSNDKKPYLVHSDLSMIDENNSLLKNSYFRYRNYTLKNSRDLGHILGPCGVMGNTILLNKKLKDLVLPFPNNLDVHDYWIAINCELFGERKTLKNPLVEYRIHNSNSSNSVEKLKIKKNTMINRDIKLPNLETNRKYFLKNLILKLENETDRKILNSYIDYLELKKSKILIYFYLIKYSLVKRSCYFRLKLFIKLLLTERYNRES